MFSTLEKVSQAVQALFMGETFQNPADPTGPGLPLIAYIGSLPEKRNNIGQGVDFPFSLVSLSDFSTDKLAGSLSVNVTIGIFNDDIPQNVYQGDIDKIHGLLCTLPKDLLPVGVRVDGGGLIGSVDDSKKPYYSVSVTIGCKEILPGTC